MEERLEDIGSRLWRRRNNTVKATEFNKKDHVPLERVEETEWRLYAQIEGRK